MRIRLIQFGVLMFVSISVACSPKPPGTTAGRTEPATPTVDAKHLPNVHRIHEKVISGGLPEGDDAFRELQALHVKTIISVDGAKPDVEMAHKFGMRYVHLPHGYDGIPNERVQELAKAVHDLEGPIYIHCHHGKHRSPTAAAVACVAAGLVPPEAAVPFLQTAGTSESYRGLYDSARHAKRVDEKELAAISIAFREVAPLPPLAEAMVAIEHSFDRLKLISTMGWRATPRHPDLQPAHEALILREHFAELMRTPEVQKKPQRFRDLLHDSEATVATLESALREWKPTDEKTPIPTAIENPFVRLTKNCALCHKDFRDVPLGEKP